MKPKNIILECVVGSHMYNLNTPESDIDVKGIFVDDPKKCLGLGHLDTVKDHTDPDWAYYELKNYCELALKMNPTITELLWADEYLQLSDLGEELISLRKSFLSKLALKTYVGYAISQVRRKYRNATDITAYRSGKHVRHVWRLCTQYEHLAKTGELRVRLTNDERKECFAFMDLSYKDCEDWLFNKIDELNALPSVLPAEPDFNKINEFLIKIRLKQLK